MTITRDQLEARVAEVLDAVGDPRYASLTTLVRPITDAVFTRGWSRLLKANRALRWGKRTVTTDATGRILISALNSGAADTLERTFKVLAAAQGTIRYAPSEFMDDPLAETYSPTATRYVFQRQGDSVLFLPATAATMTVWVNHMPQKPSGLAGGGSNVIWPDDYEMILVYEVAARMGAKGAAETNATNWFQQLADDLWSDLLGDVARFTTDPITMGASDSSADWGAL